MRNVIILGSIRYVKGVGPQRAGRLATLGIETMEDACYYAPRRYEDRTRLLSIRELTPGETATVRGTVLAKSLRRIRRGQPLFEIAFGDASGACYALWFHQPYLAQQFRVGDALILHGRVEPGARLQLIHPEFERVEEDEEDSLHLGRIVPIYPLATGIGQRWLRSLIGSVLAQLPQDLEDPLPPSLCEARGWPPLAEAIREIHFPSSWDALARSQQRLAFQELFLLQIALAQRRARTAARTKPQHYEREGPLMRKLSERLPFALTADQQSVLNELINDVCRPSPMHRLLQGDVGCGKTIVMVFLAALAVQSGYQVAVMAPTELLAEQHTRVVEGYLGPLGVSVALLSQGTPPAQRQPLRAQIASGKVQVVIGTHALIQRGVTFARLALVIIDEQHKFGVAQRAHLARKTHTPDVLVMTATPIPRTLALSLYGDLAISTIRELPSGRQPIATRWLREAQREELYALIRQQLAQGCQGYVVYPLVEERASQEAKAATQMARRLQQEVFPEFRIGLLHGQMKPSEKDRIMQSFVRGALQLLVSTVIVEVGLDVPNATIMVVEHPERFGLAQLHQLRGRIGRGSQPATCLVVSDAADELARRRLEAFVSTTDGFALAEQDLQLRGPGELLGRRQHGWVPFRIASLPRDQALLESAREEALRVTERDPTLREPSLSALRARLARQVGATA